MMTDDNSTTLPLDRWRKGSPLAHEHLNQPVEVLRDLTSGVSLPRQVERVITPTKSAPVAGIPLEEFVIVAEDPHTVLSSLGDVISVRPIGEPNRVPIFVAKPWLLRQSPFDGRGRIGIGYAYGSAQVRLATNAILGRTFTEHVTPAYAEGDIVLCAKVPTEVMLNDVTTTVDWIEMNNSRAWAVFVDLSGVP